MGRPHFAIFAGIFASSASLFGKFISHIGESTSNNEHYLLSNTMLLRVSCFAAMLVCNALVWTFFVKSLHQKGGSIIATMTSTATNYTLSALVGCLVFGERTPALWWLGTLLVIAGLVFISIDANQEPSNIKPKNK